MMNNKKQINNVNKINNKSNMMKIKERIKHISSCKIKILTISLKILLMSVLIVLFAFGKVNVYADKNTNANTKVDKKMNILKDNEVRALSAILIDNETGKILWEKNSREKRAMASTTKIMTAIIALENAELDEIVVTSENAARMPESKMGLKIGEEHILENLLYALLLESANDSAVAIAEHVAGSVSDFTKLMNAKAKEIGAYDTNFITVNGLDDPDKGHYSTAYDMAMITRYALKNEIFRKYLIAKHNTIMSTNYNKTYSLNNTNRLLSEFNGAIGVKTGFTNMAGHCFVGASEFDDYTLISVVLASGWGNAGKQGKWTDTKKILEYGRDEFELKKVINDGQRIYENFIIENGYNYNNVVNLVSDKEVLVPYLKNKDLLNVKAEIKFNNINEILYEGNIKKNSKLAHANIYVEDQCIGTIDLLCTNDVDIVNFDNSIKYLIKSFVYQFCI